MSGNSKYIFLAKNCQDSQAKRLDGVGIAQTWFGTHRGTANDSARFCMGGAQTIGLMGHLTARHANWSADGFRRCGENHQSCKVPR